MKCMALPSLGPHKQGQIFSFLLSHKWETRKKARCKVIMSMKFSTKIVKCMAPGKGVQSQG